MTRSTLRFLLWLGSAAAVAAWLVLAWRTLAGHAPASPLESAILAQADRFAHGVSPYAEPGRGDVPLMPVIPMAVSWMAREFDPGVWEPRFLTLLATLVSAWMVAAIVGDETRNRTLGAAAAALLLMGQGLVGGAGSARLDPPMLLFVLMGCQALRYTSSALGALLASMCFGVACFTHPFGLLFALAALCHLGVHDQRRLLAYGFGLAALLWSAQLWLSRAYGPWFNWAAWDANVAAMGLHPTALLRFVGTQLLGTLGVFTLATVLSFALPIRPWRGAVGIWTWMAFAAVAAGVAATQGGRWPGEAVRVASVLMAIVGPVSVQRITQHLSSWPGGSRMGGHGVVQAALVLQFVALLAGNTSR